MDSIWENLPRLGTHPQALGRQVRDVCRHQQRVTPPQPVWLPVTSG
jgi:hypothetical protein